MKFRTHRTSLFLSACGLFASVGCAGGSGTDEQDGSNSSGGGVNYGTGGLVETGSGGAGPSSGGGFLGSGGNGLVASGGGLGTGGSTFGTGGVTAGAGGAAVVAGCAGITEAGYELCNSGAGSCEAVFTDGSGCTAVCAAAGLECLTAYENAENACAADMSHPALNCDSGHQSDFCVCGGDPVGTGGAPGTGGTGSGGTDAGTGGMDAGTGGMDAGTGGMDAGTGGGGNATVCDAMGWATRNGRTGGEVAVTGGGNATPVTVTSFSQLQDLADDDTPRVIYVSGTVGSGWSGRSGDRLEVGSNKTIVGLAPGTQLRAPIHVKDSQNVIIRNLVIQGPGSSSDQAWDNLNIEGSSKNVWIDHCEFWDGQDGNADVVKGADNVTFTWNIFGYTTNGGHNFSNLVASSDSEPVSEGKLNITLMFNWFTGVAQRQPRCRFGDIHVVNNLFTKDGMASQNGVSAGVDCRILIENNHFIEITHPVHQRDGGVSQLIGDNIFENTSGDKTGYGGTAFTPPYQYNAVPAAQVKGMVQAAAGATLSSPDDCD